MVTLTMTARWLPPVLSRLLAATMLAAAVVAFPSAITAHSATTITCGDITALKAAISAGGTIDLASYCVYVLPAADSGVDGLPPVTNNTLINGNHATIRRDPTLTTAIPFRILDIASGGHLAISDLTVMNGAVTSLSDRGGGVLVQNGGILTATNVNFQGNTAGYGGGLAVASGASADLTGGLIGDNTASGSGAGIVTNGGVTLHGTTVSGNRVTAAGVDGAGGGVAVFNSGSFTTDATGNRTVIKNNTAPLGGGVFGQAQVPGWTLTLQNADVLGNTAKTGEGGGIAALGNGNATITNSTIAGNTAFLSTGGRPAGGGLSADFTPDGTSTMALDQTKVTGNKVVGAHGEGGGISHYGGALTLQNGTIVSGNLASGQYSRGGGLFSSTPRSSESLTVDNSSVSSNKVTGTLSQTGGVYITGTPTVTFDSATITGNSAPPAPAPGGVYSDVDITPAGTTTITGNTPTNCKYSPATITGCIDS
ncbi:hypothetical protein [Streptomyces sp. NPDC086787]|uniref:hypothetical protein n=1 Tax=Streptomyces sp. NPDC086787 TaxID=3365759 RepID=UPI0038096E3F